MEILERGSVTEDWKKQVRQAIFLHARYDSHIEAKDISEIMGILRCYHANLLKEMTVLDLWEVLKNIFDKDPALPLPSPFALEYKESKCTL